MTFQFPLVSLILCSFIALSACSGSDSGSSGGGTSGLIGQPQALDLMTDDVPVQPEEPLEPEEPNSPELAAISGLWNNSLAEEDSGDIDVFYLEITATGLWNNYDYRGDNVDLGANCYLVSTGQVSSLGGTNYRVTLADDVLEFSAVVTNGRLVVTGNVGTATLPAVVGLSSVDFNLC